MTISCWHALTLLFLSLTGCWHKPDFHRWSILKWRRKMFPSRHVSLPFCNLFQIHQSPISYYLQTTQKCPDWLQQSQEPSNRGRCRTPPFKSSNRTQCQSSRFENSCSLRPRVHCQRLRHPFKSLDRLRCHHCFVKLHSSLQRTPICWSLFMLSPDLILSSRCSFRVPIFRSRTNISPLGLDASIDLESDCSGLHIDALV